MGNGHTALVVGGTGIAGSNTTRQLLDSGWIVYGLSRSGNVEQGAIPVQAELLKAEEVRSELDGVCPTHVFFCTWSRQATEAENCRVNAALLRNVLDAMDSSAPLQHVALVTGLKHYLGPFEAYAKAPMDTPFRESQPRLPYQNFYYDQEDVLHEAAELRGFTWSVHRPHTMIGWALGNAMNIGVTLALYGAICQEAQRPFVFPGSPQQYAGITDITDVRLLAKQLEWAATTPAAANQAFNTVNGDVFPLASDVARRRRGVGRGSRRVSRSRGDAGISNG